MTFQEYFATLGGTEARIIGQVPPEKIQLVPTVPRRDDTTIYWDPSITHITVYKGHQLNYVNANLPLPEYWVVENSPGDAPGFTLFSYVAEPDPEIGYVLGFHAREDALKFLGMGE